MKKGDIEKLGQSWADPEEAKIVACLEKRAEEISSLQKKMESDLQDLNKLIQKVGSHERAEAIEEATYHLESLEENINHFQEIIREDHLPEACNLLLVLEEKVGGLR